MLTLRDKTLVLSKGQAEFNLSFKELVVRYPRLSYKVWRQYASTGKNSFTVRNVNVNINVHN